ncbi:GPW/gp25 family protein [Sorangium sp. So ce117]|uniref:GPW/gp25 family protein n=1 Tax=Sorangium sp. So ce117 TaxID=3133277 RepID=UPI003F5E8494
MLRRQLGRGFDFPLRLDPRGRFALVDGQENVARAIRIILGTRLGERLMLSDFGSEVPGILFEPATSATAVRMASAIRTALLRWEPRIDLLEVTVEPDPDVETRFIASLSYRIREGNSVVNKVYPFYLQEGAEAL